MRSTNFALLLMSVASLCLGVVAECGPKRELLSTRTLDLSGFTEFEYIFDHADEGDPYRIQIQHTSDGRYTFHVWQAVASSSGGTTAEQPVRDLSATEADQIEEVFSSVVIETYNRPFAKDVLWTHSYRWDDLAIDQQLGIEILASQSETAMYILFDDLLGGG